MLVPGSSASAHALGGGRSEASTATSRVAVLPVQSRSTLPGPVTTRLRGTIARGLRRADVEVVSDGLVDGELGGEACEGARCATELATAVSAAWIVRPTITKIDAVYEVHLEALDVHGRTIAAATERCEICGRDEVTELVVDRSAALAAKVRLLQRQAPRLVLRSRPSGAAVWIDDRLVGHTPLEHEVTAGEHEVRMELRGHVTERRRVTAVAGTEDAVELTLPSDHGAARRRRAWLGVGAASLGASVATLGAGIGLVVIDERAYERGCNPDPLGQCSHRYNTLEGGIALMVGGGVLLATGIAATIVGHRGKRAASPLARHWRWGRGLAIAF